MEDRDRQFVAVHVPQEYVMKVYAFVAELDGSADLGAESPLPGVRRAPIRTNRPYAEWEWQTSALAATKLPSISRVAAVLDALAGTPVRDSARRSSSIGSACRARAVARIAGCAALTRHIHAHYGRGNWPMTFTWGGEADGKQTAEAFYSVDETSAARWLEARTAR